MDDRYIRQLKDPRWLWLRHRILERDDHKCTCCGATDGIDVHHRVRGGRDPWEARDAHLVTLCAHHLDQEIRQRAETEDGLVTELKYVADNGTLAQLRDVFRTARLHQIDGAALVARWSKALQTRIQISQPDANAKWRDRHDSVPSQGWRRD